MDTQALSSLTGAALPQGLQGLTAAESLGGDGAFAQLLLSLSGQGATDLLGGTAFDLANTQSGLPYVDLQGAMMTDALRALLQAGGATAGDGQLSQLLGLLQGLLLGGAEDTRDEDLLAVTAKLQRRLSQIAEENGAEMAAQQLMAALNTLPQDFALGLPQAGALSAAPFLADGGEALLQTALTAGPEQTIDALLGEGGKGDAAAAANTTQPAVAGPEAETVAGAPEMSELTVALKPDFDAAVRSAVSRFSKAGAEQAQAQAIDADTLQQRVNAGDYLRTTTFGTPKAQQIIAEVPPIESQLQAPLRAALQNGAQEFTVKLSPAELGDVTVRLAKDAEGVMTLSLVARRAETQQLLAAQSAALQEQLKPLKVQVEPVLTERQYDLLSHQQSFDQGNRQQFASRQTHYYTPPATGNTVPMGAAGPTLALAAMLDTYI